MRLQRVILATAATLIVAGCQLTPTFTTGYQLDNVKLRPQPVRASLAVKRFEEHRPPRYYSSTARIFLTYVPLLPYVSMPYERVDESVKIQSDAIASGGRGITLGAEQNVAPDFEQYTYPASIARAIGDDLRASGLFTEAVYVGSDSAAGYRYVLSGTVLESPLTQSTTSYCLGMAGVLLWLLPVPMSKTTASVTVDLALTDTTTNAVVWRRSLKSEISRTVNLYTSSAMVYGQGGAFSFNLIPPPSDARVDPHSLFSWHFEALRRAMDEAKPELAAALSSR